MQVHKRRIFKTVLMSLGILVVLLCITLYFNDHQDCCGEHRAAYLSTRGYTRELGLTRFDEASILQKYGSPITRTRWVDSKMNDRTLILDQYLTFDVLYIYTDWYECEPYNELIQIVFKADTLRFGRKKIGIGSTQEDVQKAYFRDQKINEDDLAYCAYNYPDVDEGYYGESWCNILFSYDDNGKVISMAMQPSESWGW